VQRELEKSRVAKHSVVISGHKTSVSLEEAFWTRLQEIAVEREMSTSALLSRIEADCEADNLSSAIRLFVLGFYQNQFRQAAGSRHGSDSRSTHGGSITTGC
jgi:predicted DNA-binding ribbon-helix-helix protein